MTTLVQVVTNLISNAVKFVSEGERPHIRIRAEERGPWVRLSVQDNGIGIPPGQEERIFRVFERLTEGGTHPGTGIGLAVVRRGMERVGGSAGVEANPSGGGSCFWGGHPACRRDPEPNLAAEEELAGCGGASHHLPRRPRASSSPREALSKALLGAVRDGGSRFQRSWGR